MKAFSRSIKFSRWPLLFAAGVAFGSPSYENEIVEAAIEADNGVRFSVVQVASGLEHPWAVGWLPDGAMLVTERPGRIQLIDGENVTELSENLPDVLGDEDVSDTQGGLLDLIVHPDYAENGWVYFTYSSLGDDDGVLGDEDYGTGTALARFRLNDERTGLTDVETLYVQSPRRDPGRHYGSRIVFPGDGTVVFSIGDNGLRFPSQDLTDPAGSMIRLDEDGGAYEGNPFVDTPPGNLRPEILSYGHRNNQGLAVHPETGEIWTTEHGPFGGDLLHRIREGANYGWPQVAFGTEYSTQEAIGIGRAALGVEQPVHWWEDRLAPSGLAFYTGDAIPEWQGNLFAGFLNGEQIRRLKIEGTEVVEEEVLLEGVIGRIRDVRQGPDGLLYLVTDHGDGGVYRLQPIN